MSFLRDLLVSNGSLETLRCNYDDAGNISIYTSYLRPEELVQMITRGKEGEVTSVVSHNHNLEVSPFDSELQMGKEYYNINMDR